MPSLISSRMGSDIASGLRKRWCVACTLEDRPNCVYSLVGIHTAAMARSAIPTRERIISAANALFYNDGIQRRQRRRGGGEGRRHQANAVLSFQEQGRSCRGVSCRPRSAQSCAVPAMVCGGRRRIAGPGRAHLSQPRPLRAASEMEGLRVPAHLSRARQHARPSRDEDRRRAQEEVRGMAACNLCGSRASPQASQLARQILLLLDGSFAVVLLHRDPSYMETAGEAASSLTEAALARRRRRQRGQRTTDRLTAASGIGILMPLHVGRIGFWPKGQCPPTRRQP